MFTLENYYEMADKGLLNHANFVNQLAEIRSDIEAFLKDFTVAYKKDLASEGQISVQGLKNAYCTNAYLTENKNKLLGLGLYLLDFQNRHDSFFNNPDFNIHAFTYIILKFDYAFEEAHYRLLEITEAIDWAFLAIHRDNIANYVLVNFSEIASRNAIMKLYMEELTKMKNHIEKKSSYKFSNYIPQYILYKLLKDKLSTFKKF